MNRNEIRHKSEQNPPSTDSVPIPLDETMALAEISRGHVAPRDLDEQTISENVRAGKSATEFANIARHQYVADTAEQASRVNELISRLSSKQDCIIAKRDETVKSLGKKRKYTYSRSSPDQNGRMGVFERITCVTMAGLSAALVFVGWYALQLILAKSGDLGGAAAAPGSVESAPDSGVLQAGAFVSLVSICAFILKSWYGTLTTHESKNHFQRKISIAAYACGLTAGILFAVIYAGSMGQGVEDVLEGDLFAERVTSSMDSMFWPVLMIIFVIAGEGLAAASLWINAATTYDDYRPRTPIVTEEFAQYANEITEYEARDDQISGLKIGLISIRAAISSGEQPFINRQMSAFGDTLTEYESRRRLLVARQKCASAEADLSRHEEPGLFKFTGKTGEAS